MSHPLRIARVIGSLNPGGGIQLHLLRTLQRFDPARFEFRVVCVQGEGKLSSRYREAGFPPTVLGTSGKLSPIAIWRLARFFRRERIDIAHSHAYRSNTSSRIAAALAGVPVVIAQEHNTASGTTCCRWVLNHLLARRSDCLVAVSRAVADSHSSFERIPRDKFEVIYNGIVVADYEAPVDRLAKRVELGIEPNAPVIGIVSRLVPRKNHDVLLRAAPSVLAARPDAVFVVAGAGTRMGVLRRLAATLGIEPAVRFLGHRDDVPAILATLDVFAFPSDREGLGNVVLEAMAAGVPVVAADADGPVLEIVKHGVNGLMVPTGDPEALARGILEALQPETAGRLRAGSRARARDFAIEKTVRAYEALYERLWEQRRVARERRR